MLQNQYACPRAMHLKYIQGRWSCSPWKERRSRVSQASTQVKQFHSKNWSQKITTRKLFFESEKSKPPERYYTLMDPQGIMPWPIKMCRLVITLQCSSDPSTQKGWSKDCQVNLRLVKPAPWTHKQIQCVIWIYSFQAIILGTPLKQVPISKSSNRGR